MKKKPEKKVKVDLIIREGCFVSQKVQRKLESILEENPLFDLRIFDINEEKMNPRLAQIHITPALIVADRLWYLGDFPSFEFRKKLEIETGANRRITNRKGERNES